MITVIFIILVMMTIICIKKVKKSDYEDFWIGGAILSGIAAGIVMLISLAFIDTCVESKYIDDKIAMYEAENKVIEKDVEAIVKQYQDHEKEVFDMSEIESPTTLVQMYPELKSDKLVVRQIDIFNANNNKIKELKLKKIDCERAKFILYFGG